MDMIAACLNLEWLPVGAAFLSALQAVRLIHVSLRPIIKARLYFTAVWSVSCCLTLVYANTVGSFDTALVQHSASIVASLVVCGWLWVVSGFYSVLHTAVVIPVSTTNQTEQ